MAPKLQSVFDRVIAEAKEVCDELFVCESSYFTETTHPFPYFAVRENFGVKRYIVYFENLR